MHVHEPVTPSIALLALWAAEQPVVATFHTATPRSRSMQLAGGVLRPAIEKLHASIAVSETARLVVVQHLGRDAVVIPNGFRFADFAREPTTRPPATAGAGWSSSAEPTSRARVWTCCWPPCRRSGGPCRTSRWSSPGRAPGRCRRDAPASAWSARREKADLLGSADVFVAPHRARESFGIVVLEAMASGVPVVAADLAPFVDLLGPAAPGEPAAGALFPAGDPQALARAVIGELRRPDPARTALARTGPPLRLVRRRCRGALGVPVAAGAVARRTLGLAARTM